MERSLTIKKWKQAGAELRQAQLKLELGFTSVKICCIILADQSLCYKRGSGEKWIRDLVTYVRLVHF